MLRDTYVDLRAGYFNIPGELLEGHSIGPEDMHSDAYREWVEARVRLASMYLEQGKAYFARVQNVRHRLAGLAYVARFEWLIETLEREEFRLRPEYATEGASRRDSRMAGCCPRTWCRPPRAAQSSGAEPAREVGRR